MIILDLIVSAVILLSLIYLICLVYLGVKSSKWDSTQGSLLDIKIEKARFMSVKIKYEYVVNGNKYLGNRISYINPLYPTIDDVKSDDVINNVKKNEFKVYYLKNNPKLATLKTGIKELPTTIFILIALLFGLIWLVSLLI
jgi:hypothetical protein